MKKIFKNLSKKLAPNLFLFSILIQNIFPLSSLFISPAYASTHIDSDKVSIDFNENNHQLEIDIADDLEINYLVEYQDLEEDVTQAIQGKTEAMGGVSHADVYMGTCSADDCLPDEFDSGKVVFVGTDYQIDFSYTSGQLWITKDGLSSISSVERGVSYRAPQNNEVVVTFTKLPENPGSLSIQEIYLTDEQVEELGAASNVAYDITSNMEDGTFKYDLTLPIPEGADGNPQIVYAEDLSDLSNVSEVEEIVVGDDISVVGLNHFTVFIVTKTIITDDEATYVGTWVDYATQGYLDTGVHYPTTIPSGQTATWDFSSLTPGTYKVFISWSTHSNRAVNAEYDLNYSGGGVSQLVINQELLADQATTGSSAQWSGWYDYGTFDLNGSSRLVLTSVDNTSDEEHVIADEVLLIPNETPINLGWNIRSESTISSDRPVDVACGDATSADYKAYGDGKVAHNWDVDLASVDTRYQRQWMWPGSGSWSTDGTVYSSTNTNFATFGSSSGTEGEWNTRVRSWVDMDGNGVLNTATDVVSGWSNECAVTYDRAAPAVPTLTSPADGAYVQPTGLFLNWSDVADSSGPVTYYYQSSYGSGVGAGNALSSVIYSSGVLGSSEINASGSADNRYYWQAKACDAAGNCSDWSGPWEVNIDGAAPAQPQNLHRYIKGASTELACGDIAQRQTLIPTWDANTESDFDHYEYSSFNASGSQGLDEKVLYTNELMHSWVPPVDGTYGFAVRSVDKAGNKSAWSLSGEDVGGSCQITYDSIPPVAPTLISPANNSIVDGTVLLSDWTAVADAHHYVYESYHDENANNLRWHAEYTQSEKTANNVSDTTFWWRVKAVDAAGNESPWSDLWKITIDETAPETPVMNGFLNPTLACGSITSIHNTTVDWTDSFDLNGIASYRYSIDYPLANGSGFGHWETNVFQSQYSGSLNEGAHTIKVRALDNAGLYSSWSETCTITTDWTAPDVEITAPPAGFVNGVVDVRGSVVDDNPHHYWLVIQNSSGSTIAGPGVVNDSSSFSNKSLYSWDTTGLTDGEYIIKLEARDAADNKDAGSVHWLTVKVDNTAPLVTFTGPSQTYLRGNVDVLGSITEDNLSHYNFSIYPGGVDFNNFSLRLHSDTQYLSTGFIDRLLYNWDTTSWSDGEYLIRLAARDSVGNRDLSGDPYLGGDDSQHVREVFVDNTAPTSAITSYDLENGGQVETATFSGLIEGTATDGSGSGIDHVLLSIEHYSFEDGPTGTKYWDDDSSAWVVGGVLFKASGAENWDYQLSSVPEGVYTITSHAVDKAGNQESTFVIRIVFDKTIPEVTLTIDPVTPDADNGWYKTLPTITLAATDNYLLDKIEYKWNSESWTTYTTPINPPGEGQNILYYRGIDKVGNTTEIGVKEVKYDVTKPEEGPLNVKVSNITLDSAIGKWEAPDDTSDITRYVLSWRHESGDSNGKEVGSDVFEHKMENLYDGEWTLIVKAMDDAGNFRESSTKFTIGAVATTTTTTEEGTILGVAAGIGGTNPVVTGQVAGDSDEKTEDKKDNSGEGGQVLGTEDEQCDSMSSNLPWIMLAAQFMLMILAEFLLRRGGDKTKNIALWVIALSMPGIFYLLRNQSCYSPFIYNLFVLPSLAVTLFIRLIRYLFIEDVN